jgi:hypothetical protein
MWRRLLCQETSAQPRSSARMKTMCGWEEEEEE